MRISDWSSDVCSSDLTIARVEDPHAARGTSPVTLGLLDHWPDRGKRRRPRLFPRHRPGGGRLEKFAFIGVIGGDSSEERRVGTACVSTCRSRGWPSHSTKNHQPNTETKLLINAKD